MDICSVSVCFVVKPFSFIGITISVDKATLVIGHVACPVAFILRSILPDLDAVALTKAIRCPLSLVDSTVIKFIGASSN